MERTLCILKPDAIRRHITGDINRMIEEAGLHIIAQKRLHLTNCQAAKFYDVHKDRPFFKDLCTNMIQGPVVVQVLEGPNAIKHYRDLMGATNPSQALPGTIRHKHGESIDYNTVHGSDSAENALKEIGFFFGEIDIFPVS